MVSFTEDLKAFHKKFGLEYNGPPREIPYEMSLFRLNFLDEELREYMRAWQEQNPVKMLDALVDLCYVAIGTAYLHGWNFDEAWTRVHAANMCKVRSTEEHDDRGGRFDVIKPEGWEPPMLDDLVRNPNDNF